MSDTRAPASSAAALDALTQQYGRKKPIQAVLTPTVTLPRISPEVELLRLEQQFSRRNGHHAPEAVVKPGGIETAFFAECEWRVLHSRVLRMLLHARERLDAREPAIREVQMLREKRASRQQELVETQAASEPQRQQLAEEIARSTQEMQSVDVQLEGLREPLARAIGQFDVLADGKQWGKKFPDDVSCVRVARTSDDSPATALRAVAEALSSIRTSLKGALFSRIPGELESLIAEIGDLASRADVLEEQRRVSTKLLGEKQGMLQTIEGVSAAMERDCRDLDLQIAQREVLLMAPLRVIGRLMQQPETGELLTGENAPPIYLQIVHSWGAFAVGMDGYDLLLLDELASVYPTADELESERIRSDMAVASELEHARALAEPGATERLGRLEAARTEPIFELDS